MPFWKGRPMSLLVEAADVGEVQDPQAEEDQDLDPLRRIAAEGAEVLDDQQPSLAIEEEQQPAERRSSQPPP